jgi:hypothetical protein
LWKGGEGWQKGFSLSHFLWLNCTDTIEKKPYCHWVCRQTKVGKYYVHYSSMPSNCENLYWFYWCRKPEYQNKTTVLSRLQYDSSEVFCRSYGTFTLSCIFNINESCERIQMIYCEMLKNCFHNWKWSTNPLFGLIVPTQLRRNHIAIEYVVKPK